MSAQSLNAITSDVLTEAGARALTTRIRTQLEHLDDLLLTAWRGRVWTALGHPTWEAWVATELGTVRLHLPIEQRRAVAATWRREGMSQRAIATGLAVSKGTVATDLATAPAQAALATVISLDGRRRPASATGSTGPASATGSAGPAPTPATKQRSALDFVTDRGEYGVTVPELMKAMRWTWSQASACASRLNRTLDDAGAHTIERLAERRAGHALYVVPAAVAERAVLEPGRRIPHNA